MRANRRKLLKIAAAAGAAALPLERMAMAAERNQTAFAATTPAEVLKRLGASAAPASRDIVFNAPDVAENGAAVPIEITSRIPNTHAISIVADKNPFPLVATFEFSSGAAAYASTRIKLAVSSDVRAIVAAGGQVYAVSREVKVVAGGCG